MSLFIRVSWTFISLLTFDPLFFVSPPLCISENISEIYIPAFDTLAALYPFTLLLLTYIGIELHARDFKPIVSMWRPFKGNYERFIRDTNKSLTQVLATLFFLSLSIVLCMVCLLQYNYTVHIPIVDILVVCVMHLIKKG